MRLEAIGKPAIPHAGQGHQSQDPEVRFYSAEALAYLDDTRAAPVLAKAAAEEPAFRAFALAALSAMDDGGAYDQLAVAVGFAQRRNPLRRVPGPVGHESQRRGGQGRRRSAAFSYHVLSTAGPPMIHVTRSLRPEIVVFGHEQWLRTPLAIEAGNNILINAGEERENHRQPICRRPARPETRGFEQGRRRDPGDRRAGRHLSRRRAGIATGQDGPRARAAGWKSTPFPAAGASTTARKPATGEAEEPESTQQIEVANPVPELFSSKRSRK